ncbi:Glutathione S-transferase [Minicystis rosea]|nr:Glutathione S-transferase [Minicystis rosea]
MHVYFSPLACSMATRIALYDAGAGATYIEVDPKTKRTTEGKDFRDIHPLGLVPTIVTDDGRVLTENAAILQYVAARYPEAKLAPQDPFEHARLQQWLCFIGTELHKALFAPLFDAKAPAEAKAYALEKGQSRLTFLSRHLEGGPFSSTRSRWPTPTSSPCSRGRWRRPSISRIGRCSVTT